MALQHKVMTEVERQDEKEGGRGRRERERERKGEEEREREKERDSGGSISHLPTLHWPEPSRITPT